MPNAPAPIIHPLYDEAAIASRIESMAKEIATVYAGKQPLIVPLLRGSFIFAADLVRALSRQHITPEIDFMTLSSYGDAQKSSGSVTINKDMSDDVSGRDVVLVDDILESGNTLSFARQLMQQRGAATVKIAVFLDKPNKRAINIEADFVGYAIPDKFVVGYGLDYARRYRELPYIGYIES